MLFRSGLNRFGGPLPNAGPAIINRGAGNVIRGNVTRLRVTRATVTRVRRARQPS